MISNILCDNCPQNDMMRKGGVKMITKLNWKTGSALAALIGITGYIGFLVGQPEYCCVYPGNKDWIDYVAAFSGPFAGIIALYTAWYGVNEARKMATESKKTREAERKKEVKEAIEAIAIELSHISALSQKWRQDVEKSIVNKSDFETAQMYVPKRPIFDSVKAMIFRFGTEKQRCIANHEILLQDKIEAIKFLKEETTADPARAKLIYETLQKNCAEYVTGLVGQPLFFGISHSSSGNE